MLQVARGHGLRLDRPWQDQKRRKPVESCRFDQDDTVLTYSAFANYAPDGVYGFSIIAFACSCTR